MDKNYSEPTRSIIFFSTIAFFIATSYGLNNARIRRVALKVARFLLLGCSCSALLFSGPILVLVLIGKSPSTEVLNMIVTVAIGLSVPSYFALRAIKEFGPSDLLDK